MNRVPIDASKEEFWNSFNRLSDRCDRYEQDIVKLEEEKQEILDMLERVFLGFVYYSTAGLRDECSDLLRKHGKVNRPKINIKEIRKSKGKFSIPITDSQAESIIPYFKGKQNV